MQRGGERKGPSQELDRDFRIAVVRSSRAGWKMADCTPLSRPRHAALDGLGNRRPALEVWPSVCGEKVQAVLSYIIPSRYSVRQPRVSLQCRVKEPETCLRFYIEKKKLIGETPSQSAVVGLVGVESFSIPEATSS